MLYRIQHRRGTAAQWTQENPILAGAEFGFETDTGKFKIGNGITAWSGLKYFQNLDDIKTAIVDSAPAALDTLNELAAALNDDANYAATITGLLANKAPLNSPVFSGTVDFSNSLVTGVMLPINWTGEYSNSGEYLENDMVQYQGSTYYATGPNLNFIDGYYPTALNADWELFAAKGDTGPQGPEGPEGTIDPATPTVAGKVFAVTDSTSGNVFLGPSAGANEAGSNKLYIANSNTSTPIIGGDFSKNILSLNGSAAEKIKLSADNPASISTFSLSEGPIKYLTGTTTKNWTLSLAVSFNFETPTVLLNNSMDVGQSITIAFLATNGSTAYYPTGMLIDGNSVTVKWQGGTAPSSGNANAIDLYNYTVIKTGSGAFTVLGSQTKFA